MDLIAAHRLGLVEQLETEARALAGGPGACAQRAVVYFHLYDHGGASHGHALLCAEAALDLPRALAAMTKAVGARWWWRRARRSDLLERVAAFGAAAREIDRRRCEMMTVAYRLAATPGLAGEARLRLPPALADAFAELLVARRDGEGNAAQRRALFEAHDAWLAAQLGGEIEAAVAALDWPLAAGLVERATGALRVTATAHERAERDGWSKRAAAVRRDPALPAAFAANPGQHYYRLQRDLAERRRKAVFDAIDAVAEVAIAA